MNIVAGVLSGWKKEGFGALNQEEVIECGER